MLVGSFVLAGRVCVSRQRLFCEGSVGAMDVLELRKM
jgi:hypothetical protein